MDDREKIENSYRKMYRGMVEKDRNILSEVLDHLLNDSTGTFKNHKVWFNSPY